MNCKTLIFATGELVSPVLETIINSGERKGFDLLCSYPPVRSPFRNHARTTRNEFIFVHGSLRMIYSMYPKYATIERFG